MPADLTLADLDRIEALHAAATQGPWVANKHRHQPAVFPTKESGVGGVDVPLLEAERQEDADLIAEVRNSLPALLRLARLGMANPDSDPSLPPCAGDCGSHGSRADRGCDDCDMWDDGKERPVLVVTDCRECQHDMADENLMGCREIPRNPAAARWIATAICHAGYPPGWRYRAPTLCPGLKGKEKP